jgi:hypothetical protein
MGMQVVITSSSDVKLARAENLGSHGGIDYRSMPDWKKGDDGTYRGCGTYLSAPLFQAATSIRTQRGHGLSMLKVMFG